MSNLSKAAQDRLDIFNKTVESNKRFTKWFMDYHKPPEPLNHDAVKDLLNSDMAKLEERYWAAQVASEQSANTPPSITVPHIMTREAWEKINKPEGE